LIMDVAVPRPLPNVYWQAIAYDSYENGIWRVAEDLEARLHFPDDGPLDVPPTGARERVTQTITNYLPNSSFLYAAPQVIETDRQMFVEGTRDDENHELVAAVRSRFVLRQGDPYVVASRVSNADAESLRNAGTAYPDWVTERYLQLPDSITPETINLAEELAAPYDTPYDVSIAIRNYLRDAIEYNDQIDAPPDGAEPVHYTLFESKEGYCNYYASAMAIMLRSQGIPARVVSGYAQGEYDDATKSYRVRANNAHTWVQVYFPLYGWIQFEPTSALPLDSRPETAEDGNNPAAPLLPPNNNFDERFPDDLEVPRDPALDALLDGQDANQALTIWQRLTSWQVLGAIIVLVLAAATLYLANIFNKRVESDVDRSYQRLGSWARWLGILYQPTDTPYERADMISTAVPEGRVPIRNLTQEYVRKRFSADHQTNAEFNSLTEWQSLRPLLIRQTMTQRLQRWRKRLQGRE
jgi:transglutaminase-like putative cysteine protease